jgi:hypothetical protein
MTTDRSVSLAHPSPRLGRKQVPGEIKPFKFLGWAVGGLLTVFAIYTAGLLWATQPISEISINKAASFGDSFGVITSLFAGLGFAGVLATIFLQREELKLTRRELQETKITLARQRFEDTFYRMIDLYRQNLDGIMINSRTKPSHRLHGLDALDDLNDQFARHWKELGLSWPEKGTRVERIAYVAALDAMVRKVYVRQTRYVETLNNLLDLIGVEGESPGLIQVYQTILSSQFTAVELTYLFYQAFIHREFLLLRQVFCSNDAFRLRIETLQIPNDHRQAWNYLYTEKHCQAPMRRKRYRSAIPEGMQSEAAAEIKTMREQIRHLRSPNPAAINPDDDP